ncbi:hypothetical protein [uncultured Parabacteroides sp.]|uniref:hypothetical protein n=1 Tax=uncultured Parabacteroides sp. TaxID=512312 RepID=UPI002659243A|nr:hypothetical protein [uncultured Parabacteroides sp.]
MAKTVKISSKKELRFYIQADRMMNLGYFTPTFVQKVKNLIWPNKVMNFLVLMRKCQYYLGVKGRVNKLIYIYYKNLYNRLSLKLGFSIAPDVFGYGLVIPHYGTIVVGPTNDIGNYCVLHTSTCISGNGEIIGNALYLSTGAKITAQITLGDNISIGANTVVTKSFEGSNLLLVGVPARIKMSSTAWYIRDGEEYHKKYLACESLKHKLGLI